MKQFQPAAWFLPQPVTILGTYNEDGSPNAMNAAWAGQWDMKEIMISMGAHQTTANLNREGVFTLAFATEELLVTADYVGIVSGKDVADKVARTGWAVENAEKIHAPLFTDFPLSFECRIKEKHDESASGCYIVAEVLNIHAPEDVLGADGIPDMAKMNLIVYNPIQHTYHKLGPAVGKAFADGKKIG